MESDQHDVSTLDNNNYSGMSNLGSLKNLQVLIYSKLHKKDNVITY